MICNRIINSINFIYCIYSIIICFRTKLYKNINNNFIILFYYLAFYLDFNFFHLFNNNVYNSINFIPLLNLFIIHF